MRLWKRWCGSGSNAVIVMLKYSRNHKISLDMIQNAFYDSLFLKIFTVRLTQYDVSLRCGSNLHLDVMLDLLKFLCFFQVSRVILNVTQWFNGLLIFWGEDSNFNLKNTIKFLKFCYITLIKSTKNITYKNRIPIIPSRLIQISG